MFQLERQALEEKFLKEKNCLMIPFNVTNETTKEIDAYNQSTSSSPLAVVHHPHYSSLSRCVLTGPHRICKESHDRGDFWCYSIRGGVPKPILPVATSSSVTQTTTNAGANGDSIDDMIKSLDANISSLELIKSQLCKLRK